MPSLPIPMVKFYLTTNVYKSEPRALVDLGAIHVKAMSDGTQTIMISDVEAVDDNAVEKTFLEAQTILDTWIDAENDVPALDPEGNPMVQNFIDLGAYLA